MTLNPKSKKWQLQIDIVYKLMSEQLNNEEAIGNSTQSRTQIDEDGNVRNKISGSMTRHKITAQLYNMVEDMSQLCESCRLLSPVKNGAFTVDEADKKRLSGSGKRTKGCIICDVTGFLNAESNGNEKRGSVFNVSDAISEVSGTRQRELHTRLDSTESAMKTTNKDDKSGSKNMIFHEESRNSTYHQSVVIDLDRIGYDDHKMLYVLDKEELKKRIHLTVKAVLHHYLDIQGAMMAAHKPHVLELKGTVRESTDSQFVNANYSTMTEDYLDIQKILNKDTKEFKNPVDLLNIINEVLDEDRVDEIIERNMKVVEGWRKAIA